MKIRHLFILIVWTLALVSCKDENSIVLNTSLQLTGLKAELDGMELFNIPIRGFEASIDDSIFNYTTNLGQQTGNWSINDDENLLKVTYNSLTFDFPVIFNSTEEITFIVNSIDLNNASLNLEEQQAIVLVNQQLSILGRSWYQESESAQKLDIIFTIKFQ